MDPYAVGDTILFACDETDKIDTMVITEIGICNPPNTSIFDLRGCNWMKDDNEFKGVATFTFDMLHGGEKFDNNIATSRKECHKKPATFSIYFLGSYSTTNVSTGDAIKRYIDDLNDKGTLVINDTILQAGPYQQTVIPIKKIYWNRENGLTGYKIGNDVYRLKR